MFDKEKMGKLIMEAKGNRSLRAYALESNISVAHLSRFSRGLIQSPPTVETIKGLASHAQNGITLDDFMKAAGYEEDKEDVIEKRRSEIGRMIIESGKGWSVRKGKYVDYDLIGENGEKWEWIDGFSVLETYGKLAVLPPTENKRSIVVRNNMERDDYLNSPPQCLKGVYSLVYVRGEGWEEIPFKI